MLLNKEADKTL